MGGADNYVRSIGGHTGKVENSLMIDSSHVYSSQALKFCHPSCTMLLDRIWVTYCLAEFNGWLSEHKVFYLFGLNSLRAQKRYARPHVK